MKKRLVLVSFLILSVVIGSAFMGCKARKTVQATPLVSYQADISPLFVRSCTPCHFPEKGRKKMLNTYEAVAENIDEILHRVSLTPDNKDFMPFKSKREPLTSKEIEMITLWEKEGMPR